MNLHLSDGVKVFVVNMHSIRVEVDPEKLDNHVDGIIFRSLGLLYKLPIASETTSECSICSLVELGKN